MCKAQVTNDKITLLVIKATSLRAKSTAAMKAIINHVYVIIRFYLDVRQETKVELTGDQSAVLLRDYLEPLAERVRTVPSAAKHALTVWAEALGIDWPLTNPLVCSAAVVETNESPKQAPPMSLETVRDFEDMAVNKLTAPYNRTYAAGILLMTYGSLRFPDAQRLRSFEVTEGSARGALLSCKTRKQHGQFWPWARPIRGITGSLEWVHPLMDMRQAYRKINGADPSFPFARLDHVWELVASDASPYSTTRRKIALLCVALGARKAKITHSNRRKICS